LRANLGVQRTERLVQQQHPGLNRQRPRQCDTLTLAPRQLRGQSVGGPVQLHHFQQMHDLAANLRLARTLAARAHSQPVGDVLIHSHVPEQRVMLEHKSHAPVADVQVGSVLTMEANTAAVWLFQPGDDAQQSRLARAGRAQQRCQLAIIEGETDVINGDKITETLVDLIDFNTHGSLAQWVLLAGRWRSSSHSTKLFTTMVTNASPVSSEDTRSEERRVGKEGRA